MVSWEHWQTLLAVYRSGTYAAAASTLGINATTVGRRIKLLEQRLGASLFLRHDGKLVPTTSCAAIFPHLESVAESLRAAEHESALTDPSSIWRDVTITTAPFLISNLIAPAIGELVGTQRIRIDLLGTGNNISLTRREADIALKIEDGGFKASEQTDLVVAEQLDPLLFAVYVAKHASDADLPWAGLTEDGYASAGMTTMNNLAGSDGFQFRARHFDALHRMVRSGATKAMLPCFMGDTDSKLMRIEEIVLSLPLWMLSHRQDQTLAHLADVRQSIANWCHEKLT